MTFNYDHAMSLKVSDVEFEYGDRETILYALGLGFGRDPMDENDLPFVYEKDLKTVPTMATVIGSRDAADMEWKVGLYRPKIVHSGQSIVLHKPLPPSAKVLVDTSIIGIWDKGKEKGAVVGIQAVLREQATGDRLCTLLSTIFARGDGGFGGPRDGAPEPHTLPERNPDLTVAMETRDDQAVLYRLSGDRNPLHLDPEFAKTAGFDRPILHGLCTYGMCCKAIIANICNHDPSRITSFAARFSSPVFPGETLLVDIWKDGDVVSFRARVQERDIVALNNGKCTLGPSVELPKLAQGEAVYSIP